jgi:hypothetical protein
LYYICITKAQELKEKGLFSPLYKSGDTVFVSTYVVTKPTHEQRGSRMVRVRYEEKRRYDVFTFVIDSVLEPTIDNLYKINHCLDCDQQYPISYTTKNFKIISQSDIFENREEATSHASDKQKAYNEACDLASMCR